MDTPTLTAAEKDAFLGLLDDASPAVRKALLAHFVELGDPATHFLQEISRGSHRLLARHAAWFLEELKFNDPSAEFRGFIRSLNYELETGMLLIARTVEPDLDVAACYTALEAIAERCRQLISSPASTREQCRIINRVMFHEWSFRGNVERYNDPRNSLLGEVLSRRKGIPLSLSVIYLLVARRLGLELEPVALPGHVIIGCFESNEPFFLDPFDQGLFLDADEVFELLRQRGVVPKLADLMPTPVREILCRCCRNLAGHYAAAGDAVHGRLFTGFVEEFEASYVRETPS